MSTGRGSSANKKEMDQDVELNIASIVDCFTVLITYLLAAASFVSIGALDAGLARTSTDSPDIKAAVEVVPPSVYLSLELKPNNVIRVRSVGAENWIEVFSPKNDGAWDFEKAVDFIKGIQQRHPDVNALTVLSDNSIKYKDLIEAVKATKKSLPVFFVKNEAL